MKRRKVDTNVSGFVPEVQLETYLSSIASVRAAVEAACLDEGTTFKSMGNFDYDAFYMPLMMIEGQVKAVMWAVDRWAFRAKYMKHIRSELKHIYRNKTLTDDVRFAKISHRLSICMPYDSSYCRPFRSVSDNLKLLLEAGTALFSFLSQICEEDNVVAFNPPRHPTAYKYESPSSSDEEFSTASSRDFHTGFKIPAWKLDLAHKYAQEKLYVGPAEHAVFVRTLELAQIALLEITKTIEAVDDIADLADDMQHVFDAWSARCEKWEVEYVGEAEGTIDEELFLGDNHW